MKSLLVRLLAVAVAAALVTVLGVAARPASADDPPQLGVLATLDVLTLIPADDPILADPANNDQVTNDPPHLPPGGKFKLFGTAKDDIDPENAFNEVISFDTKDPFTIAGAFKLFGCCVKIDMLDNQVEVKYHYVGRTCGGGSTRIQLGIDGNGDGKFNQFPLGPDQNAFGYLGDKPFGGGCAAGMWVYEDMTNAAAKWDLSQFGGSMTTPWDVMEIFINMLHPNHRVLNEVLVDDSHGFFALDQGCAYFDLVSAGARTLTGHDDTNDNPTAANTC
jgi:hypothetical protein